MGRRRRREERKRGISDKEKRGRRQSAKAGYVFQVQLVQVLNASALDNHHINLPNYSLSHSVIYLLLLLSNFLTRHHRHLYSHPIMIRVALSPRFDGAQRFFLLHENPLGCATHVGLWLPKNGYNEDSPHLGRASKGHLAQQWHSGHLIRFIFSQ